MRLDETDEKWLWRGVTVTIIRMSGRGRDGRSVIMEEREREGKREGEREDMRDVEQERVICGAITKKNF